MFYILGAGISGQAAAKYIAASQKDQSITIIDQNACFKKLSDTLDNSDIKLTRDIDFSGICADDTLVPSPGIPEDNPIYAAFESKGCRIISEIDLALRDFQGKVIAVTGTNGKSTTVAMLSYTLNQAGYNSVAAGNIGLAPCEVMLRDNKPDIMCLELSSYQLQISKQINPDIVIFTNFSPDHLERHKTIENYFLAKWNLIKYSKAKLITCEGVLRKAEEYRCKLPEDICVVDPKNIAKINFTSITPSLHNQINAAMAIEAMTALTSDAPSAFTAKLTDFGGLEHRCEIVQNDKNLCIVNDSKSTNVDSTVTALNSFDQPLVLIIGGVAKKESFTRLGNYKQVKHLIVFGQDKDVIYSELADSFHCVKVETLSAAVTESFKFLKKDIKTLLFSPACASFDQFQNFEKRGLAFKQIIGTLV